MRSLRTSTLALILVALLRVHAMPAAASDATGDAEGQDLVQTAMSANLRQQPPLATTEANPDTETTGLGGEAPPSITPSPSPTPSLPTCTVAYRSVLKTDTCNYLYDLSSFLMPHHYSDEPIRENLLHAAKAAGCWHGGWGADYLKPILYRPIRGDQGPHPNSGYPHILKAKFVDKTVVSVHVDFDDPETTGKDLTREIAFQVGKVPEAITVYRNKTKGHPIHDTEKLNTLDFHYQDFVYVDFDLSTKEAEKRDRTREEGFYKRGKQDPHTSLHGIDPN